MNEVEEIERHLGIEERWQPGDPKYLEIESWIKHKEFITAVEELEGRVVQRLFELSKANLASTGYKLRRQISRNITRRSLALRTSLDRYNTLAPQQDPPRAIIQYAEIANYAWLGDFDLLKHSRHDILSRPWSDATNREACTKYFKYKRAREELVGLNVEVWRLQEWVDSEDEHLTAISTNLLNSQPLLAAEVSEFATVQRRINNTH